jgi:hypothetical protein
MGDRRVEVAPREVPQFEVRAYGLIGDWRSWTHVTR